MSEAPSEAGPIDFDAELAALLAEESRKDEDDEGGSAR